jgi:SPP1 family predicted phage head-tail adaptor
MRAGLLRHRVSIETLVTEIDSDGIRTELWVPIHAGLISAQIAPVSGRELIAAQAVQSKVSTRITIRYRPDVAANMRVVHRTVKYNIEGVIPDPDSGYSHITLMCASGVNEG